MTLHSHRKPPYYGNRPSPNPLSDTPLSSAEIQASLLALSDSNPSLQAALSAIFNSAEWVSQAEPVDEALITNRAIRFKEFDESGAEWWPCQLGCPGGIPVNGAGTKITQATHAKTHIEWHLGLCRYACRVW